ncbi:hypothetical protein GCM10025858_33980 [Alicyclobacillus sacchari]|nr:hypothetical protein GCM10025858_33980 [Alicyclobacillus sacchari]
MLKVDITVVGSLNMDIVAVVDHVPQAVRRSRPHMRIYTPVERERIKPLRQRDMVHGCVWWGPSVRMRLQRRYAQCFSPPVAM